MTQAEIVFHNTLSGKRNLMPADPAHAIYVCGPTVYNPYILATVGQPWSSTLTRLLRTRYPKVTYVSNITDIDDKINAAAASNGEDIQTLADRYSRVPRGCGRPWRAPTGRRTQGNPSYR